MLEHGLEPDLLPAAAAQLRAIAAPAMERGAQIRDQRSLLWCSIDNDDSRDLDQLSVAQPLADGAVRILIAIADVDASIERGSPLDAHAATNTTSVYTAAQIFPMFPERLSTDLTCLAEGEERLSVVIDIPVAAAGSIGTADIYRAVVVNRAKLAYDSVATWLDGRGPPPPRVAAVAGMDGQLRNQDAVAQLLKRVRRAQGSLTLNTLEAQAVYQGTALIDLKPDERNRAKELIEDFMIAANGVTAAYLERRGFPSLRRVLRSPDRWERIVALAAATGDRLPAQADARALEAFLERRRAADPVRFPDLSLAVVKLLGRGEYVLRSPGEDVVGHFGLAVRDYTHSTAPNRRFPDLATQRLLKAALAGEAAPYRVDELSALATHCTTQEDNATKVERRVRKSAAALLLAPRVGERFDAIVTGASAKGTWVRLCRSAIEGKVVRGATDLDVGDRVRVELVHTDVERGFIDFARTREGAR